MKFFKSICILFSIAFALQSCNIQQAKNIQDCTFSCKSISNLVVDDISFEGKKSLRDFSSTDVAKISKGLMTEMPIEFTAQVAISNPNNQKAELSALEWIYLIGDIEVANGLIDERTIINGNETITIPLTVETNTNILKQFSLTEIKNIIFAMSNSKKLPDNSVLKVKPVLVIGKTTIKAPAYFTIDISK